MSTVTINVDGHEVQARVGERLLGALLRVGIDVPNLCFIEGVEPPNGGCRLCWVEVEGRGKPVTSCTQPVSQGLEVRTRTPAVDRLVRAGFEMLLSTHRLDCKDCPGNRRCALQDIAKARKIPLKGKRLNKIEPDLPIDESRPDLGFNPNHCVANVFMKVGFERSPNMRRACASSTSLFDSEPSAAAASSGASGIEPQMKNDKRLASS